MQIIVVIREGADRDGFKAFLQQKGFAFTEFSHLPRIFEVEVGDSPSEVMVHPDADVYDESDNPCRRAGTFPDGTQQALVFPANMADPVSGLSTVAQYYAYSDDWALHRIVRTANAAINHLPAASSFNCYRSGVGVDVYVLDSGVDTTHPDLLLRATQVYSAEPTNVDDYGHGTACASLAAGTKFGAAKAALIWGFKCIASDGSGTVSTFTTAANQVLSHYQGRAATNRPAVLNMSLAFTGSDATAAIMSSLIGAGIVCCAASGNNGWDMTVSGQQTYPATDTNVLCVGGTTISDAFYAVGTSEGVGSNWGSRVDVLAPSFQTRAAALPNGNSPPDLCHTWSGTSMGCAVTSGVVACMLQGYARLTSTAQVQAVRSYVMSQANALTIPNMAANWPNTTTKLLYLDPSPTPAAISGLTPMATPDPNGYFCKGVCPVIGLAIPVPSVCHEIPQPPGIVYPKVAGVTGYGKSSVVS